MDQNRRILLFGGIGLLAGFTTAIVRRLRRPGRQARGLAAVHRDDDVGTKMIRFAEQAVLDAESVYHRPLDYSPGSVENVEAILTDLSQRPNFAQYTDKDVRAEALIFGAYIGEVVRRMHGGYWAEDHPRAGPGAYALYWGSGQTSFPYGWCYKRLKFGRADNVWHKFRFLVTRDLPDGITLDVAREDSHARDGGVAVDAGARRP